MRGFLRAPKREWIYRGSLILGYAAVHLAYGTTRVRFRADTLDYFAQFLDPPLLQDRLVESLWYLHAQPPLLNLLGGLALKIAPANPALPLWLLFVAAGLASCGWMAGILRRLDFPRPVAAGIALCFVATPPFVLYRNWFFYPHLAQTLLLGAGYCFVRSRGGVDRWIAGAFWALATLVALRSLYHPLFLLLAVGVATLIVTPSDRSRSLARAAAPVTVILLLALKNSWLFGFFGTSSWSGNGLHRMMTETLDRPTIERMVQSGELSPISLEWEFSPPEKYLEILGPDEGDRGVPALDMTGKTRARENSVNYNHWVYPIASREYAAGARRMLRRYPTAYLRSLAWTARRFVDPVTEDSFLKPNRFWIRGLAERWERFERGALYRSVLAIGLLGAGIVAARPRTSRRDRMLLAFAAGAIVWTAAIGILFEFGENNRFRYQVTALTWILPVYVAREVIRWGKGRRPRGDEPAPRS